MSSVRIEHASCHYAGTEGAGITDVDLDIASGELVTFVGEVGSGRSTLLRMVAGLEEATAGRILIDGTDVTDAPPSARGAVMVLQNYALYPHLSVADNMGFALRLAGVDDAEIDRRVRDAADLLDLADRLDARPQELRGDERQRVSMGRAIVRRPKVFLMDEPLSSLSAPVRERTRDQIRDLQQHLAITTLYVTDDLAEAAAIGDRVAQMAGGRLVRCVPPAELG